MATTMITPVMAIPTDPKKSRVEGWYTIRASTISVWNAVSGSMVIPVHDSFVS